MANTRMISFLGLLAQGTAVVVSILLAFAIQAWWDDRQERDEERRILIALAAELQDNIRKIQILERFHGAKRDSAFGLIEAASESFDPAQVDPWLCDLTWTWESPFATGALDSVLVGGRLPIIENDELRRKLAEVPLALHRVDVIATHDWTRKQERLLPFLSLHGSVAQIWNVRCGMPGYPEGADWGNPVELPLASPRDHSRLLDDSEFVSLLTLIYSDQIDAIRHSELARQTVEGVLAAIEAELEGMSG